MKLSDLRREYTKGGLRSTQLNQDPIEQFNLWLQQAIEMGLTDPTAMTVATVNSQGQPSQRIVLLKNIDNDQFVFFTNLASKKAQELNQNHKISLHFPWNTIDRQVHITGRVEKLSATENIKYFATRPRESQLAAWASKQSERLSTRRLLESKFIELRQKFVNGEIPVPSFWGGFRVKPDSIEFWQGGENRLHDRFIYISNNHSWSIERLAP